MRAILIDWLVEVHLKFKVGGRVVSAATAQQRALCLPPPLLCRAF
jgi:hypothetical protein